MLKWIKRGRVSKRTELYGSVRRQEALFAKATRSSSLSTEQKLYWLSSGGLDSLSAVLIANGQSSASDFSPIPGRVSEIKPVSLRVYIAIRSSCITIFQIFVSFSLKLFSHYGIRASSSHSRHTAWLALNGPVCLRERHARSRRNGDSYIRNLVRILVRLHSVRKRLMDGH